MPAALLVGGWREILGVRWVNEGGNVRVMGQGEKGEREQKSAEEVVVSRE